MATVEARSQSRSEGLPSGPKLTVGVLGGMGPEATLDFFAKLLAATPAGRDQDRLRVLIDNNPQVPNRNEAVAGTGPSPAPLLANMARGLEAAGAQLLVMPCNAAHAFEAEIRAAVKVPFLSIIVETVAATSRLGIQRVGVLAAAGTLDAGLYANAFERNGIEALEPRGEARDEFMELLYLFKSGDAGKGVRIRMRALANSLVGAGAEAIVAGCTEVPLLLGEVDVPVPLVNSTDVLVDATAEVATGRRLPSEPELDPHG
ncbi:MAG TPA: amino acid racemase [Trueperaceae bacterium]